MMKKIIFVVLVMSLHLQALADTVVIVNAKSPVVSMTREEIAAIYLGRNNTFPNGERVLVLEQKDDSLIFLNFYQMTTGKTLSQVKAYWAKMVFAGRASPPKQYEVKDIVKMVASNVNAIAYIDRAMLDSSVKVIYP
jgi:ABC-type phosphate transport system substrate-binding protein